MLGWLRRRLVAEQRRLIYQNRNASSDTELRILLAWNGADIEPLDEFFEVSGEHLRKLESGKALNGVQADVALSINSSLRSLHDSYAAAARPAFDELYKPIGGWNSWHKRGSLIR